MYRNGAELPGWTFPLAPSSFTRAWSLLFDAGSGYRTGQCYVHDANIWSKTRSYTTGWQRLQPGRLQLLCSGAHHVRFRGAITLPNAPIASWYYCNMQACSQKFTAREGKGLQKWSCFTAQHQLMSLAPMVILIIFLLPNMLTTFYSHHSFRRQLFNLGVCSHSA